MLRATYACEPWLEDRLMRTQVTSSEEGFAREHDAVVRYGAVSQVFHWTTVGLVIALLAIGWGADVEADKPGSAAFMWHSSLGVLIFVLALVRVIWRLFTPAPVLPAAMGQGQRVFARAVHV